MVRRKFLLAVVAIAGVSTLALEMMPKRRQRLAIDPNARDLIYEDGWIVRS